MVGMVFIMDLHLEALVPSQWLFLIWILPMEASQATCLQVLVDMKREVIGSRAKSHVVEDKKCDKECPKVPPFISKPGDWSPGAFVQMNSNSSTVFLFLFLF
ncbi:hypothetical protein Cni_G16585 [Canna indica]|uniref:Uncharacterized protein n=1 Tax=Canna indica TaxID=4628 RepID=A0AAQ3QCP3_9LILI|nr:hypothetical protein Cni_G16585 [Canna indica]